MSASIRHKHWRTSLRDCSCPAEGGYGSAQPRLGGVFLILRIPPGAGLNRKLTLPPSLSKCIYGWAPALLKDWVCYLRQRITRQRFTWLFTPRLFGPPSACGGDVPRARILYFKLGSRGCPRNGNSAATASRVKFPLLWL